MSLLGALFGPRDKLPADHVTRVPRAARKAAAEHVKAMQATLDRISALPGIADVSGTRRMPRGFYDAVAELRRHYDGWFDTVRKFLPDAEQARRPGEPGGTSGCYAVPMPVHGIEALSIYRTIRTWRDFPQIAQRLAELGEAQQKEIQSRHTGKDPEKIRGGSKAVQHGRIAMAKQLQPCPFLDQGKQRCRIWEERPIACRMHLPRPPAEVHKPDHADWPKKARAHNVRLPVRQQLTVHQLDKRLALGLSPFLYASVLQVLQLAEGKMLPEVGEVAPRMQQDGQIAQRANRNVGHAKKFDKDRRRQGRRRK